MFRGGIILSYYIHSLTDKNKKVIRLKNHHNKLEYKYKVFIKRKLEVKDILTKRDFFKLKNVLNDINNILEIPYENIEKLYIDRNRLFDNHEVYEIIKNNIFAGRISVKLWRIEAGENDENISVIKSSIEKSKYYNKNLIDILDREKVDKPTPYTCIKLDYNKYLLRVIVPIGTKVRDDGIEMISIPENKNIVCIIDLDNKYIEVRAEYKISKLIISQLKELFNLDGIVEINILSKHNNSIEVLKNSFMNAKFINVKSIPLSDSNLTEEQTEMLIDTLKAIDEFYIEKDYNNLINSLKNIDISTNEIGFIPLLLGGLSKIGISSKLDNIKDITNQPMYKLLEGYLLHQSGYLRIVDSIGKEYSIQIGISTNNIIFKSNCTDEKFIDLVRSKLINIYQEVIKEEGIKVISDIEVEEVIRSMAKSGIRSFYVQYFAQLMDISIVYAFKLLNNFAKKTNKIKIKYEIRCSNCMEEILQSVDNIQKIDFNSRLICPDCGQITDISKENIYMCYYISEEWINSMNKIISLRPNKIKEKQKNIPMISLADLEKQSINIENVNVNINYGRAGSMGNRNNILEPILT